MTHAILAFSAGGTMFPYMKDMRTELKDLHSSLACEGRMRINEIIFGSKIQESGFVPPQTLAMSYTPEGGTRLYDVITYVGDHAAEYVAQQKETMFVVMTSNKDYASESTLNHARRAIKNMDKHGIRIGIVEFGENAHDIGRDLGIRAQQVLRVRADLSGLKMAMRAITNSTINYKRTGMLAF